MDNIDLGFTCLEIHDRYFIARTREGIDVSIDMHNEVMEIARQHLQAPFGMILDEQNSYSVDLPVMLSMRNDPDLACIAVLYYRRLTRMAHTVGAALIRKPHFFSTNLEEAKYWLMNYLEDHD